MRKFLRISIIFGLGCYIIAFMSFLLAIIFRDSLYPYEEVGNISLAIGFFTWFIGAILIGIERVGVQRRLVAKEEDLVNKNYDPEQCSRRKWNEKKKKWERAFGSCSICSYMCPQREEDFKKMGKKEHVDKDTSLHYWT